jgi:hypothetical protein
MGVAKTCIDMVGAVCVVLSMAGKKAHRVKYGNVRASGREGSVTDG